jgi:hypothetical protein
MRKAFGITLVSMSAAINVMVLTFFIVIPIATEPMTSEIGLKVALGIFMLTVSSCGAWLVYDDINSSVCELMSGKCEGRPINDDR